ncbi:DUF3313 domain-containing protein [Bordetella sp. 15P40C-2]|uniref:DUF3313 domain-containing protein n=1 Tax=Bordetella sp. 15P40C-2 TaxID=2572246 RepID=UPI00132321F6|nr:DUF3313 domain-containing protein [Bordetella sp. 15P40C-2]MVW70538.1 DUF3313 family protein [Bordetella sp. 15P40C-2]
MGLKRVMASVVLAGTFVLAGCASKVPTANQYSGFLGDYTDLHQTVSASGAPVLRWVEPGFDPRKYKALVYEPVRFYPRPEPNGQVSQQALDGLLTYTNAQLREAAAKRLPLVNSPGEGVLIFRGAITAVNTSDRDLKPRELIPVALVIAGTRAAAGMRPKDTNLYFEGELLDGVTKKPVLKVVRKGQGKQVDNSEQQVTLEDLKGVIDGLAADAAMFDVVKK